MLKTLYYVGVVITLLFLWDNLEAYKHWDNQPVFMKVWLIFLGMSTMSMILLAMLSLFV